MVRVRGGRFLSSQGILDLRTAPFQAIWRIRSFEMGGRCLNQHARNSMMLANRGASIPPGRVAEMAMRGLEFAH